MPPSGSRLSRRTSRPLASSRYVILAATIGFYITQYFQPYLLPQGPAEPQPRTERPNIPKIDFSNDSLTLKGGKLKKIYERVVEGQEPLMKGPETVVIGNDGTIYVLSEEAKLLKLTDLEDQADGTSMLTTATEVVDLGVGRPLGAQFDKSGTLWIADSILGLTRVRGIGAAKGHAKVELIASSAKTSDGKKERINFVDDVVVGPVSGKVYFTSATDIRPEPEGDSWDCLQASKMDLARAGHRRGKILEYDPRTDQVRILTSGIHFANGISVDKEEQFLLVSETFQARAQKYYLDGPKKGILEPVGTHFPAYPDGCDCNPTSGLCYVALITTPGAMAWIYMLPHPIDRFIRTLIMALPQKLSPKPPKYGAVAEIDPSTGSVVRIIQDPYGVDVPGVAGVTVYDNKIYLGFLNYDFIAIYDLN